MTRAAALGGGLRKYSKVGSSWVANGGVFGAQPAGAPAVGGLRGLTGIEDSGLVTLYGTQEGALLKFVDASGYNGTMMGAAQLLATPQANTLFRGLDFAPFDAPATFIPGDFDGDQEVDAADLTVWRARFGEEDLDGTDFLHWQRNLGEAAASAVPEPSPAIIATMTALLRIRRRCYMSPR